MRQRVCLALATLVALLAIGGCGGEGKSSDPLGTDSLAFGDSSGSAVIDLDLNGAVQLTAKVKDAAGKEVADREVFFDIVPNASGATLSVTKVVTNAAGEATILYRAGGSPGFDVVRAFISNGTRMDVSITVGGGAGGAQVSLSAAPSSLAAGQSSIITATVTNTAGDPLKGQAVTFAFTNNNSGATIITVSGTTDVSGRAIAVYTAGAASPTAEISDTIQAAVAGSADALVITRTAAGATGVTVSVAASATSLAAGQIAVITATVTDGASAPVVGQAVTFSLSANNSGATLTPLGSGVTDVSGRAVVQYRAGASNPTISVQDTVLASVTGSAAAVVITRTVVAATGFQMDVTASGTRVNAGESSILTATVRNADGTAASGQQVTFSFMAAPSGATVAPINSGITDASGRALAVYTAGSLSPSQSVQDIVLARTTGTAAAVVITRVASSATGTRISSLTAVPSTLPTRDGTSVVTATAVQSDGVTPAAGVTVTFSLVKGLGTVAPTAVATNGSGQASAVFIGPGGAAAGFDAVQAQIQGTTSGSAVVIINWP
ncbi:MAG: beta strand repeat-containing protein [Syntrophales bacterium]